MKKTGLKTFVCSFVFSLFTILAVNEAFFHTRRPSTQELKIPNQNIALFFKDELRTAAPYQIKPVKKIALTVAVKPDKHTKISSVEAIYTPSSALEISDDNSSEAPLKETADIPLEITASDVFDPSLKITKETPKVSQNFESMIKSSPPVADEDFIIAKEENIPITLAEKPKHDRRQLAQAEIKERAKQAIQSITESDNDTGGSYDTGDEDYSTDQNENIHSPKNLILAQADSKEKPRKAIQPITESDNNTGGSYDTGNEDYSADNEPQNLLIPLQRDYANANKSNKIKIEKTPAENQIALAKGNIPIKSMASEKISEKASSEQEKELSEEKKWETMAEKNNEESPWVVAKGTKFPKNNSVLNEDYYKNADTKEIKSTLSNDKQFDSSSDNDVKLASDMVQNILIPIPEDIMNDENLTPQLESSNKTKSIEAEVSEREKERKDAAQVLKDEIDKTASPEKSSKGGLLKSITSIFSSGSSSDSTKKAEQPEEEGSSFVDRFTNRLTRPKNSAPSKILPVEMRLSFQPNRAEISGTTLKWIQAFANKVNQDSSVILEIRIDGSSSYALQQKRLNLLHNILTNKGVDYSKINTVFTTREPNSFIIRTVRVNSNIDRDVKENKESAAYYQSW